VRDRTRALVAVHAAGLCLALWAGCPPAPSSSEGAPGEFSAVNVQRTLAGLMGDGRPRPVGSAANGAARARIVAAFESLGYTPEIQSRWVCGSHRQYCAEIHNVIARLETGAARGAVLLNAHYDSMAATPGAADCLAGVAAALEAARALKAAPPAGDVIFLVNDGEEAGLLGATAFVDDHPWAADVQVVVNLEARGSGGPSWPVYTTGADRELLSHYLSSARRPAPGSLALALTSRLPLTNDLAVFARLGVPGVTMGFARHPRRYHTPRDDLTHLSPGSLAQHGRQAVDLARSLAAGSSESSRGTFAAIGPLGIAWPVSWAMSLAIAALGLVAIAAVPGLRRHPLTVRQALWAFAAFPLLVLVAFFGAALLNAARRAVTEIVSVNVSDPRPSFIGFALWGLALVHLMAPWLARRAGPQGAWIGTWGWWALLGVGLAWAVPEAAYLTLIPVLAASFTAFLLRGDMGRRPLWRMAMPALVAALVWYPNLVFVYDLAGIGNLPPVAGLVAIVATTTGPLADGRWARRMVLTVALAALALVGFGTRVPTFTDDQPQYANLTYVLDADRGQASWTFSGSPLPATLGTAAEFGDWRRPVAFAPQEAGYGAPAPVLSLAPPRFDVATRTSSDGSVTIEGRLISPRGARVAQLVFPSDRAPERMEIAGAVVPPDEAAFALFDEAYRVFTVWTLPAEGVPIVLTLAGDGPVGVRLVDRSGGLPEAARVLEQARPSWSAPVGPGDQTVVTTEIELR